MRLRHRDHWVLVLLLASTWHGQASRAPAALPHRISNSPKICPRIISNNKTHRKKIAEPRVRGSETELRSGNGRAREQVAPRCDLNQTAGPRHGFALHAQDSPRPWRAWAWRTYGPAPPPPLPAGAVTQATLSTGRVLLLLLVVHVSWFGPGAGRTARPSRRAPCTVGQHQLHAWHLMFFRRVWNAESLQLHYYSTHGFISLASILPVVLSVFKKKETVTASDFQ